MGKGYTVSNEGELNASFEKTFNQQVKELNSQLEKVISFTFVGNVNTGKSSIINAIAGEEVAKTGPTPGETTEIYEHRYLENIIFTDTPGLHDIAKENSDKTLGYFKKADLILFVLNAAGEVFSSYEKKVFKKIKNYNDNILIILNKIDAAEDIPELKKFIENHTDAKYEVIPVSVRTGENMDDLKLEILKILERTHMEMLFSKHVKKKSFIAQRWIISAAMSAGVVKFPLISIFTSPSLIRIQVKMLLKLSHLYEKPLTKTKAKELVIATLTANIDEAGFKNFSQKFVGFHVINAINPVESGAAIYMTFALGQAVKYAYENKIELNAGSLKGIYEKSDNGKEKV